MRDELLNETLFFDLDDARAKITAWIADYNGDRPHSSLKYLTPGAYAATRSCGWGNGLQRDTGGTDNERQEWVIHVPDIA
jgi:hypothetical protein